MVLLAGLATAIAGVRTHARVPTPPPPPRLPRELIGEWIQVYPAEGALSRVYLRSDSTLRIAGSTTVFESRAEFPDGLKPDHWYVDARISLGELCVGEKAKRRGDCYFVRLIADTLWFLERRWPVLVRAREGAPSLQAPWSDTRLPARVTPNSNSFRPPVSVRVFGRLPSIPDSMR